jgi:hypothetical protein
MRLRASSSRSIEAGATSALMSPALDRYEARYRRGLGLAKLFRSPLDDRIGRNLAISLNRGGEHARILACCSDQVGFLP